MPCRATDELGFVPLSKTGAELLFELISQRYEQGSTLITSNLPFEEWTETFGTKRLTGALLDRLTHHVNILEMNGESHRLNQSRTKRRTHQGATTSNTPNQLKAGMKTTPANWPTFTPPFGRFLLRR